MKIPHVYLTMILLVGMALSCSHASGKAMKKPAPLGQNPAIGSECMAVLLPEASPIGAFTPQPRGKIRIVSNEWICLVGTEGEIWIPRANIAVLIVETNEEPGD